MPARSGFTRRDVLKAGGAGALALGVAGCASDDFEQDVKRDPDAPNVLLIVTDSTRADYLGVYNPESIAKTPNLDALAGESLKFGLAVPESMPTGAVRRALLSGMRGFPFRDWVESPPLPAEPGWTPIGEHQPMFTEVLGKAGVNTAYCTDNPFIIGPRYAEFRRTLDMARPDYSQGHYRAFNKPFTRPAAREEIEKYLLPLLSDTVEVERLRSHVGWNQLFRRGERDYSAARVMRSGMKVLDELTGRDGPFFLGVDSFDPHEPFDAPRAYVIEQSGTEPKGIENEGISPIQPFDTPSNRLETIDLDDETLDLVREMYAAEITYADEWIGRLLNKVDDMGLTDDTMVIYLSDHGLTLGEHGIIGKAASRAHYHIYHVPFMMRDPRGRRAGETSDFFASTHDVARTILSTMGVRAPGMMDGEDLTVLFDGKDPPGRPFWTACYADNLIAGDGRWLLMSSSLGGRARRLFDTQNDPGELKDVAADNPEMVETLWTALTDEAGGSLPMFGQNAGVLGG
ncbi:MAG: sulfatase-like hydrolase/transferase [Actinomycetota bacterium]|nr:sulfatase-like hydrolase/transferase [Actinomycetota bacterium]